MENNTWKFINKPFSRFSNSECVYFLNHLRIRDITCLCPRYFNTYKNNAILLHNHSSVINIVKLNIETYHCLIHNPYAKM